LPRPETLRSYDHALPGLAERIVVACEKERDHRHAIEDRHCEIEVKIVEARIYATSWGLWSASALGFLALVVAGVLTALGHPILGAVDLVTFGAISASGAARRRGARNADIVTVEKPQSR
jgi:uncharacterized membrane protein